MTKHALKIEELDIKTEYADSIVDTLKEFAETMGFHKDRISELECRRRDGFSPYSHNKGGIECVSFLGRCHCVGMGLRLTKNAQETLEEYHKQNEEYFRSDNSIPKDAELTESQLEAFDEYCAGDTEATVCLGMDIMLNSESELNIRITVSVKDSPYHRQYDDLIDIDIEFKGIRDLKAKLKKVLKRKDVSEFSGLLVEAY